MYRNIDLMQGSLANKHWLGESLLEHAPQNLLYGWVSYSVYVSISYGGIQLKGSASHIY